MPAAAKPSGSGGFTLLEVVVALTIAGLGLVALFDAVSGGMTSAETAAQHTTAVRHAESHLAELGITLPLRPGELRGSDSDGYRWRIRISPVATHAREEQRDAPGLTLFAVETLVNWSAGKRERSFRLDSLRLGPTSSDTK